MKKFAIFIIGACLLSFMPLQAQEKIQRPKVGVVLSGGGAKGMAHISALKVIEEVGIPIDYIVGTSMGSIIGGLYAIGYTPEQMDSMVRKQDWTFLLTDRVQRKEQNVINRENNDTYLLSLSVGKQMKKELLGGVIRGENLANLFSQLTIGYHDSIDFSQLPVPFACVSEDVVNGEQIVFHSGVLSTAMRASMAIPAVFTPVRKDSMVLVDGGTVNNYPVDVAKQMGADVIIGIDVQNNKRGADELNGAMDIINQLINLMGDDLYKENLKRTDVYIKVDVEGYSAASFSNEAIDTLLVHGEEAARGQWDSLMALKRRIGMAENERPDYGEPYPTEQNKIIKVNQITIDGLSEYDEKWLRKRFNVSENSEVSLEDIEKVTNNLRANLNYSSATYSLSNADNGKYNLSYHLTKKSDTRANIGTRFDSKENATLLLNGTTHINQKKPNTLSATIRLGKRMGGQVQYAFAPTPLSNISLGYKFMYNDIDYYHDGEKTYNSTFRHHSAEFSYSNVMLRNVGFALGLRYELYDYVSFLYQPKWNEVNTQTDDKTTHFFTYFAQVKYESMDKPYFPTKGFSVKALYELYTDNFTHYNDHGPISAVKGSIEKVFQVSNRFAILPSAYARLLFGKEVPYAKMNVMGGDVPSYMLTHELPFIGINSVQLMDNSLLIGSMKFRQQIGKIHYVTLSSNYALNSHKIKDLFNSHTMLGVGISYGMDTIIGPIELTMNYTNRSKKVTFFFNLGYKF